MEARRAVALLNERISEAGGLRPPAWGNAEFEEWYRRTESTLSRIFEGDSQFVRGLAEIQIGGIFPGSNEAQSFDRGMSSITALLRAAIYEIDELASSPSYADADGIDPELWEHVRRLVEQEQWSQVASQACIFVESHVRQWAARPPEEVGSNLMTAVLRNGGEFPLGRTDGEREGWHHFARGFMGAIRNVDTHHIQERADAQRYALGVLGAASLLLTQLRFEHGNRFRNGAEKPDHRPGRAS